MFCHDCHEPMTDYATLTGPANTHVCYACADTRQRMDMQKTGKVFAYLTKQCKQITTWTGGALMRVTHVSPPRNVGFGRRIYVNAIDPTGRKWYGSGPADSGEYVRMTRSKH